MNWVERRFRREQNLKDKAQLWSAVCAAVCSAVESWNQCYLNDRPKIEIHDSESKSHLQIVVPASAGTVRIDLNLNGEKFVARYSNQIPNQVFYIDADHESAYVRCGNSRCDADEVSRRILEPVLLPGDSGGPKPGILV